MAVELKNKPVYVVLAQDEYGYYVPSVHFNEDQAIEAALEKSGEVLTANLHINYTRG